LDRFKQIERLHGPVGCLLLGYGDDLAHAGCYEDTFPETVLDRK
jgi:hypothetical protein